MKNKHTSTKNQFYIKLYNKEHLEKKLLNQIIYCKNYIREVYEPSEFVRYTVDGIYLTDNNLNIRNILSEKKIKPGNEIEIKKIRLKYRWYIINHTFIISNNKQDTQKLVKNFMIKPILKERKEIKKCKLPMYISIKYTLVERKNIFRKFFNLQMEYENKNKGGFLLEHWKHISPPVPFYPNSHRKISNHYKKFTIKKYHLQNNYLFSKKIKRIYKSIIWCQVNKTIIFDQYKPFLIFNKYKYREKPFLKRWKKKLFFPPILNFVVLRTKPKMLTTKEIKLIKLIMKRIKKKKKKKDVL